MRAQRLERAAPLRPLQTLTTDGITHTFNSLLTLAGLVAAAHQPTQRETGKQIRERDRRCVPLAVGAASWRNNPLFRVEGLYVTPSDTTHTTKNFFFGAVRFFRLSRRQLPI